jgi:hypothetical protein
LTKSHHDLISLLESMIVLKHRLPLFRIRAQESAGVQKIYAATNYTRADKRIGVHPPHRESAILC